MRRNSKGWGRDPVKRRDSQRRAQRRYYDRHRQEEIERSRRNRRHARALKGSRAAGKIKDQYASSSPGETYQP